MAAELEQVRRAVEEVPDPELPPVTIGMLGMVHDVTVDGGTVSIELLPTFSGCPATEMISRDVVDAVRAIEGVEDVRVRFRFDPPWTPERISAEGRERLRGFGIAPPQDAGTHDVSPEGRPTLPLVAAACPCPYCGSTDTERESMFGPTPCRDVRFCSNCQQPFEAFKTIGAPAT